MARKASSRASSRRSPDDVVSQELRRSSGHLLVDALDDVLAIDADTEHHLRRVLRVRTGETISATDGGGRWRLYRADVDGGLSLEPIDVIHETARVRPAFTLVTAIPKGDRVDWLVQKCTELGVDRIRLVHAERSVVRWDAARAGKQVPRLQRIADEAVRQSRRVFGVVIDAPVPAGGALAGCAVAEPGGRRLRPDDSCLAIGPEGGWSESELAGSSDKVDLGPTILRTETAAVVACALAVR